MYDDLANGRFRGLIQTLFEVTLALQRPRMVLEGMVENRVAKLKVLLELSLLGLAS